MDPKDYSIDACVTTYSPEGAEPTRAGSTGSGTSARAS